MKNIRDEPPYTPTLEEERFSRELVKNDLNRLRNVNGVIITLAMSLMIIGAVLVILLLSGCATYEGYKVQAEETIIVANDSQLRISKKALCSSSLSAIHREYGDDRNALVAMLVLCGWGTNNTTLIDTLIHSRSAQVLPGPLVSK